MVRNMYLSSVIKKFMFCMSLLFSVNAFGFDFKAKGVYFKITSEEELTVSLTAPDYRGHYEGDVVIPEYVTYKGKKYNVTSLDKMSFWGCNLVNSLTIPNSIVSIEASFSDCYHIKSVTLHCKNVKENMFGEKKYLETVMLGKGVETVGKHAFYHCPNLKSLTISNTVKTIGGFAFEGCRSLESVTIPSSVRSIGKQAFWGCENLRQLVISEGVVEIGSYAFAHCKKLTSVVIPNSVKTSGNEPFYACGLSRISVPKHFTTEDLYPYRAGTIIKRDEE